MGHTMIRRIWLMSGIRQATLSCTYSELRDVLERCERTLQMKPRGAKEREEWLEYEDWRQLLIHEIQRRQLSWFLGRPV